MLKVNYQPVGDRFRKAIGGIANESRFSEGPKPRQRRSFVLPALNCGGMIKIEQAWNPASIAKDVVRMTITQNGSVHTMVFNRKDLEQVIFAMAQDDETLKYFKTEAAAQREWSEPTKKYEHQ